MALSAGGDAETLAEAAASLPGDDDDDDDDEWEEYDANATEDVDMTTA
jgi:hypothetical protein